MVKNKFIFDVDGTLTPSRGRINVQFATWFSRFCETHEVYLVTGSDRPKTIEQIGELICHRCERVYHCSGNDVWAKDQRIRTSSWYMPDHVRQFLQYRLDTSKFVLRTGQHFDERPGSVNFSILGRGATLGERQLYRQWDIETNERNRLVVDFKRNFGDDLEISAGGETGVDIYPYGCNKSQILTDFDQDNDFILFFGDRMDEHGNDRPLADALFKGWQGANYHVEGWQHTWELLKDMA